MRLSSAHCITNQCYHGKFKCNHAGLYFRVKVCRLVVQDEIQVKKNVFFVCSFKKAYKYLDTSEWKEECVYIF